MRYLSGFSVFATLPCTLCLGGLQYYPECFDPPPGLAAPLFGPHPVPLPPNPPPPSAMDCRFLLAQIPSLPRQAFPIDVRSPAGCWDPFELILRHRSCVLQVDAIKFVGPTASDDDTASLTDFSPAVQQTMIFALARAVKVVGEKLVVQCVDGRSLRGFGWVRQTWDRSRMQFRVNLHGVEGRERQEADIGVLRARLGTAGGQDVEPQMAIGVGFKKFYFEV